MEFFEQPPEPTLDELINGMDYALRMADAGFKPGQEQALLPGVRLL